MTDISCEMLNDGMVVIKVSAPESEYYGELKVTVEEAEAIADLIDEVLSEEEEEEEET